MASSKVFTTHEKPDAADIADRVVLVREGFSYLALAFNLVWLLANRLWLAAAGYVLLVGLIQESGAALGLSEISVGMLQLGLQVMLGACAYDLKRHQLVRRGYELTGVVIAESAMAAQQRHYAHAH